LLFLEKLLIWYKEKTDIGFAMLNPGSLSATMQMVEQEAAISNWLQQQGHFPAVLHSSHCIYQATHMQSWHLGAPSQFLIPPIEMQQQIQVPVFNVGIPCSPPLPYPSYTQLLLDMDSPEPLLLPGEFAQPVPPAPAVLPAPPVPVAPLVQPAPPVPPALQGLPPIFPFENFEPRNIDWPIFLMEEPEEISDYEWDEADSTLGMWEGEY
jgi:hypothetical protein